MLNKYLLLEQYIIGKFETQKQKNKKYTGGDGTEKTLKVAITMRTCFVFTPISNLFSDQLIHKTPGHTKGSCSDKKETR